MQECFIYPHLRSGGLELHTYKRIYCAKCRFCMAKHVQALQRQLWRELKSIQT